MFMHATVTTIRVKLALSARDIFFGRCAVFATTIYLLKMIDPSKARALVVDMCAGQMRRPKIPHSAIYYKGVKESIGIWGIR